MQRIFHTPEGVRDIYGDECRARRRLMERLHEVFRSYGYEDIETPSFEYFEVFGSEVGTTPCKDLYKFFDREGNTLVLRPDFTPSVSRASATYFEPDLKPVSLCYTGNTFVNTSGYQGRPRQSTQMGVERIGDGSALADAEILAMTVECLLSGGLKEFQVSVGQVDYFKSLLEETDISLETELRLRELISQKNFFGVEELVSEERIPEALKSAFTELPQMFGDVEVLERARSLTTNEKALEAVSRLGEIYELLKVYGYEKYISFDFGMVSKYRYYTGIIFQAFTYGTGEPLIRGGRYDGLMRHFGKPAASIGFAIVVDSLLTALSRQNIPVPGEEKEPVLITCRTEDLAEKIREAQELRRKGIPVRLQQQKEAGK